MTRLGNGQWTVDSGQWLAASCWWRKRRAESTPVEPPNQGESNQIKPPAGGAGRIVQQPRKDARRRLASAVALRALAGRVGGASRKRRRCCGCATFARYRGYSPGLARIKPNQGESSRIKPNQTKSNLLLGWGDGSGQWTVDSGWWRKGVGEDCPVKPSQSQSNQKVLQFVGLRPLMNCK